MKIFGFFTVAFLLFFIVGINAQQTKLYYKFTQANSDLPSNTIYNIVADKDGNIWLATAKGLVKYNGTSFKTFNLQNGIADEDVVNLFYQPEQNTIWALTFNSKLIKINTKTNVIENLQPKEKIVGAFMYTCQNADTLKFYTSHQIVSYINGKFNIDRLTDLNLKNQLFANDAHPTLFNKNLFTKVAWQTIHNKYFNAKYLWLRNSTRIGKYNTTFFGGEIFFEEQNQIYSLLAINKFVTGKNNFVVDLEILGTDLYLAIYGANGGIYVAKDFFLNPKNAKFILISQKGNATSITKDKIGNIWYTLQDKGLNVISKAHLNIQFVALPNSNNENFKAIKALNDSTIAINDLNSKNYLLLNANNSTINGFSKKTIINSLPLKTKLLAFVSPFSILTKDISTNGQMLFGNYITLYDKGFKTIEKYQNLGGKGYLLTAIRKGDYYKDNIIFNTSDDSIYVYNRHLKQVVKKFTLPAVKLIKDIYFLNDNYILFCTANGIYTTDLSIKNIRKISNKVFFKAIIDSNKVYLINETDLAVCNLNNSTGITNIFSSKSFISRFNILDFSISAKKIHLLTDIGYIGINKYISKQQPNIQFNLTALELQDTTINYIKDTINLNHLAVKQIKFILNFLNTENNNYQKSYSFAKRSENENWINFIGNSFIQPNLTPGKYTLKIRTKLPNINADKTIQYLIIIKPKFWQTTWFLILCILLFLLIVAYFNWLIFNKLQKTKQSKIELKRRIADIENKAFLNQLNPHFLYNALNTLQDYIIQKDTHNGIIYLQRIARLHRNILQFNQKEFITVADEKDFLERYLFIQQKRYSDKFSFEITMTEEAKLLKLPPMLLQPIVENAIEHGFIGTAKDNHISIVFKKDRHLKIIVTDNGNGDLEKISQIKNGHALHIIKERLNFINQKNNTNKNQITFNTNTPKGIIINVSIDL